MAVDSAPSNMKNMNDNNNDDDDDNNTVEKKHVELKSVLSTSSVPEIEMHRASQQQETGLFRRHFSVKDRLSVKDRFSHPHASSPTTAAHITRSLECHKVDIVQNYFEGSHQSVDDIRSLIERETDILSIKNISYRSAYFSRLFLVETLVSNIEHIFTQKHVHTSLSSFLTGEIMSTYLYFKSFKDMQLFNTDYLWSLVQPAKIAGAVTLTGLFITLPALSNNIQGPLWPGITICFIRQDASASSFLTSYQRLEGTVIGCFFTIVVYIALRCPDPLYCNLIDLAPFLIVWTAVCCFFREGPMHGYTGVTAALTPIVLLLGSYVDSAENIIFRVANTIIAIVLYLLIDMYILPTRTDTTARAIVVRLMRDTTDAFSNSVDAVQPLLSYCNNTMGNSLAGSLKASNTVGVNADAGCEVTLAHSTSLMSDKGSQELTNSENNKDNNNNDEKVEESVVPSFGIDGIETQISVVNSEEGEEKETEAGLYQALTGLVDNASFNQGLASEFAVCDRALQLYEAAIRSMIKRQKGLTAVLLLGMHEPDIFSR